MSDTFCSLPFMHLNAYPNNKLKVCCYSRTFISDTNLEHQSTTDAFNSEEYKQIRRDLLTGVQNSHCSYCWDMEKSGGKSERIKNNEDYGHLKEKILNSTKSDGSITPDFAYLDLRPSNICNFKCRTCTPDYSTAWISERKEFNKLIGSSEIVLDTSQKTSFEIPKENLKSLEKIYFAGGEPLYMDAMYQFLESLENKDKITLTFNTNLSIIEHKGKSVFDLLKNFKAVNFGVSCDGAEEVGEYVRTNFNWKVFCNNLRKVQEAEKIYGNFSYRIQYTCSVLNCFHFFEFRNKLFEERYIFDDNQIFFGFVEGPFYLNTINFDIRLEVIEHLEKNMMQLLPGELKQQILNFIQYLKNSKDYTNTDTNNTLHYFRNFIEFGHKYNKTSLPIKLSYLQKYLR